MATTGSDLSPIASAAIAAPHLAALLAARRLAAHHVYDAECALHYAHQAARGATAGAEACQCDRWVAAAYAQLHAANVEYAAAAAAVDGVTAHAAAMRPVALHAVQAPKVQAQAVESPTEEPAEGTRRSPSGGRSDRTSRMGSDTMPQAQSTEIFEHHESQVRSYCRSFPAIFERAGGSYLWDTNGHRYVDLLCGAGALNYGHNPRPIVQAVTDYLANGGPIQSLDLYTSAKAEFLSRFATEILAPRGLGDFVVQFPGPAGTLAVEAAMKLARKVTGRTNVIAFRGGFHGASLGSLAATTSPLLRGGAGIALSGVTILPYGSTGGPSVVDALERELRAAGPVPPPAAILLETVQGEGGLFVAAATWLAEVRRIADRIGALVIVDDIQAGCGRTGTFFSFEHVPDFQPDLVCLSKSLSGMGLPMAALLIRRDHDVWAPGEHNGTFRGHNLAFVGGTAALDYWADASFVGHVTELAAIIESDIAELAGQLPTGTAVPVGRGSWSGLRFADAELAGQVREELFEARIIAETCGRGRVLKLMPPLTITRAEWSAVIGRLSEVVLDTSRRSQPGDYLDLRVPA